MDSIMTRGADRYWVAVECASCGARGPDVRAMVADAGEAVTTARAVTLWNMRRPPAAGCEL
jgi:hypothetical protein